MNYIYRRHTFTFFQDYTTGTFIWYSRIVLQHPIRMTVNFCLLNEFYARCGYSAAQSTRFHLSAKVETLL